MSVVKEIRTNDWYLFIDESGTPEYKWLRRLKQKNNLPIFQPDPQYANSFALIGLLISGDQLCNKLIPAVKEFKNSCYGDEDKVLHFADMLAGIGKFEMYKNNPALFNKHLSIFVDLLKEVIFNFNLVFIDNVKMLNKYINPAAPYELAPAVTMEKAAWFICKVKSNNPNREIRCWFEARSKDKDEKLKGFMLQEIFLDFTNGEKVKMINNFPRFKESNDNIKSIRWHIHSLPKDPSRLKIVNYYKEVISYELGKALIQGIHVADILVSAYRHLKENQIYLKVKDLEVDPIKNFIYSSEKLLYEKCLP